MMGYLVFLIYDALHLWDVARDIPGCGYGC